MSFEYRDLRRYKYQLTAPYRHRVDRDELSYGLGSPSQYCFLQGDEIIFKAGYAWDGPSGPTIDTKSFMRGSLVHDGFYQLIREGALKMETRDYSDRLLVRICRADGMNRFRAWYVYWALRLFGAFAAKP